MNIFKKIKTRREQMKLELKKFHEECERKEKEKIEQWENCRKKNYETFKKYDGVKIELEGICYTLGVEFSYKKWTPRQFEEDFRVYVKSAINILDNTVSKSLSALDIETYCRFYSEGENIVDDVFIQRNIVRRIKKVTTEIRDAEIAFKDFNLRKYLTDEEGAK